MLLALAGVSNAMAWDDNHLYTLSPSSVPTLFATTQEFTGTPNEATAARKACYRFYGADQKEEFEIVASGAGFTIKSHSTGKYMSPSVNDFITGGFWNTNNNNPGYVWKINAVDGTEFYKIVRNTSNDLGLGYDRTPSLTADYGIYSNKKEQDTEHDKWIIAVSSIKVTIHYMNGTEEVGTAYTAYVALDGNLQTMAEEHLAGGYRISGDIPAIQDGTYSYDIPVEFVPVVENIVLTFVDYITETTVGTQEAGSQAEDALVTSFATAPTGYKLMSCTDVVTAGNAAYTLNVIRDYPAISGNLSRSGSRYTEYVTLQVGNTVQKISGVHANNRSPIYVDMRGSGQYFTRPAGALIKPELDKTHDMNAMQGYCYIDEDYDGTYSYEADATNHCAKEGSDLKTWGGYQFGGSTWYNSEGKTPAYDGNQNVSFRISMPAFYAPTTPGKYCMRLKTDWNNLDPAGASGIGGNGGAIVDVILVVTDAYTANYVDAEGEPVKNIIATVTSGASALNADGANVISVGSVVSGIMSAKDFQTRGLSAVTPADITAAAGETLEVAIVKEPYVKEGCYYTIQGAGAGARYAYDNPSGTNNGQNLFCEPVTAGNIAGKHMFQFEKVASDGHEGMFFVKSAATGRYVKTPNKNEQNQALRTNTDKDNDNNFAHWVTNTIVPGRSDLYALGYSSEEYMVDPNVPTAISKNNYWHNNTTTTIMPYATANTAGSNSQWYIKRVPVITVKFQDSYGEELTGVTFTADGSLDALAAENKVLATVRNFDVQGYSVVGRQLKEGDGLFENFDSDRAGFYSAVADLNEDAEAIITLRPRSNDEVDVTLELWKAKGKGYTDAACTTGEVDFTANAASTAALKSWTLYNDGTLTDINGNAVPEGLGFTIISGSDNGVGGQIVSTYQVGTYYPYKYGRADQNGQNCICFTSAKGDGNTFTFQVPEGYYILQYEFAVEPGTNNDRITLTNPGGGTVNTANPASNAMAYNLTDTPAAQSCTFNAMTTEESTGDGYMAANFFQVRIVNEAYLENSKGHGRSICWKALQGGVGYPKKTTQQYADLESAIAAFDASDNLTNYCKMLKAYSAYISCRVLQTGDDCAVYTLSFIKNNGDRMLLENVDGTLTIVDYSEANRAKSSARWISHKNDDGKMVFVNKADGKYLQAKTASDAGLSTYYDAGTTAFTVEGIHQDINDYMQSATDEKLLGAVYLKSASRVTDANRALVFTMQNSNNTWNAGDAPRFDDYTTAIAIEEVENGNTFNEIDLRAAYDGNWYATYYGFYPVAKPDGAKMYYVNSVSETGYMELVEVQADVIRPNFPVILKSEGNGNLYEATDHRHLHIGEYTEAAEADIAGYLEGKQNLLQGTLETVATSEATTVDGQSGQVYVLYGNDTAGVGFYKYTAANLPKGKAYYVHPATTEVRGFRFTDENGVETTVELAPAETSADAVIYDLSGRRVNAAKNGLFIINGKKVIK